MFVLLGVIHKEIAAFAISVFDGFQTKTNSRRALYVNMF